MAKKPIEEYIKELQEGIPPRPKPIRACAPVKGRKLALERRNVGRSEEEKGIFGPLMITPPVSEEYWNYRVVLSNSQAVVGFEKFMVAAVDHRERILSLMERLTDFHISLAREGVARGADCIWLSDDHAGVDAPFLSPAMLWEMDFKFGIHQHQRERLIKSET